MAIGPYTTDVLVFAGTTNNVRSQSDYLTLSPAGNVLGTQGDSSLVNKALRQVSVVANTLTKLVADRNAVNITDGTTPLTQAILYPLLETALNQQTIPLPISQGGTNTTELVTNQVLTVGTNASGQQAITGVSPGDSGNVLTSNGTQWTSSTPINIGFRGQAFTTSGTFTIPVGVSAIKVILVGAGGGGSGTTGATGAGTAGTASSLASGTQTITTVTAGGGGAGSLGLAPSNGGAGGTGSGGAYSIPGIYGSAEGSSPSISAAGSGGWGYGGGGYSNRTGSTPPIGYGSGGNAIILTASPFHGGSGGGGALTVAYLTNLTANRTLTVTVGTGGSPGPGGGVTGNGTNGIVIFEW